MRASTEIRLTRLWIHAIAIAFEIYLRLTPAKSERLREVSYQRQRERGFRHPGTAGLVAEKLGDANPYVPVSQRKSESPEEMNMLATGGTSDQYDTTSEVVRSRL
jgi:hypothetical protein